MNPTAPASPKAARLAGDVARHVKLSEPALKLLAPSLTPRQFFELLAGTPLPEDAIRFLAAALPKREAVGWGLMCLKELLPRPIEPVAAKAIGSAEAWVKDQSEANRRSAGEAADAAGYGTAAGNLAAAAFWSGGSLAPPHLAPVPPRDDLTATAVAGAILLATVVATIGPELAKLKCVALGNDVANGKLKV